MAVISLLTTAEELNAAARLALQAGLKRQSELQEQVAMPVAFAARLNAGPIWPMTW